MTECTAPLDGGRSTDQTPDIHPNRSTVFRFGYSRPAQHRSATRPATRIAARITTACAAGLLLAGTALPARAGGVLERIARSGELVLSGYGDLPPLLSAQPGRQPEGYGALVAERIAAGLSQAVGRPVTVRFQPVPAGSSPIQALSSGKADVACAFPFSWEQDMRIDHSLPIGLSGLRLLAPLGRFDGNPAGLAGRSIGVVRGSLAEGELLGMQPRAKAVSFDSLPAALTALQSGKVEGVIGDSIVLTGLVQSRGLKGLILTPELPYEVYGVTCLVPQNDSAFRHQVNLAIARMLQEYLDGEPKTVAAVNRILGPESAIGIPEGRLQAIFAGVLIGVETIRIVPAAAPVP
jgi:polar amino acid transport system substrate-binding protein